MRHPKDRPLTAKAINRRQFLARSAGAAAAIPTASALLAACGSSSNESKGNVEQLVYPTREKPATYPIRETNPTIESGLQPETGATLKLYSWDQYFNGRVLNDFEKKFDCKVEVSTFANWDEGVAKIQSGQGDWDIYMATFDLIDRLQLTDLIQPLNHDYLPNIKNIWPQFGGDPDQPFYDQGSRYSIPYTIYSTGVGFRNDLVDKADQPGSIDNPYDLLWNPKYSGKIGLYDDWGFTMAIAMVRSDPTVDINTAGQPEIDAAVASLLEANKATNPAYGINITYEDLPKGSLVATSAWSGDMIAAPYYGKENAAATAPLLTYWTEGVQGLCGSDTYVILKDAANPVLAHEFINYMLDEDVSMKNFGWVGYQSPYVSQTREYFKDRSNKWSWIVYPNLLDTVVTPEQFDSAQIFYEWPAEQGQMWTDGWAIVQTGI